MNAMYEARGITIVEVRTTLKYWMEGFMPKERAMQDTGLSEEEPDLYAHTGTCLLLQAKSDSSHLFDRNMNFQF